MLHYLIIFLISMVPLIELRGAIPYAVGFMNAGYDINMVWAYIIAIIGNMIPVPFIIVYIRRIFEWMRRHMPWLDSLVTRMEEKGNSKRETIDKYGHWGLLLFVAIPLPGTGAWTGALIAALLDIKTSKAVPVIMLGVCVAAMIMTLVTYGVIHIVL